MKTLFSLKSRIGAILTAAALLATAMPMTGLAATATTAPELVTNGNFNTWTATTQDMILSNGTSEHTVVSGTALPANWELSINSGYNTDTQNRTDDFTQLGSVAKVPNFKGDGFTLSQTVNGLVSGETYTLSYKYQSDNRLKMKAEFLHYDEDAQTYTAYADYVAECNADDDETNDIAVPNIRTSEVAGGDASAYTGKAELVAVGGKDSGNYLTVTRSTNFTTPVGVNAVKLSFSGDGIGNGNYARVDDVSLKLGSNVVVNGDFETKQYTDGQLVGWQNLHAQTDAETGNQYFAINAPDHSSNTQNILLKANTTYRVRFKYRHTLGETIQDKTPFIVLAVSGGARRFKYNPTVIGTDGDWTIYEGYFNTGTSEDEGLVPHNLVNISISCRSHALSELGEGAAWERDDGQEMHYDDISITETSTMSTNLAGGAVIEYSPAFDGETAELIVAKYEPGTNEFVGIERETIGSDSIAGYITTYVATMAPAYDVKAFLWSGLGTMKPVANTVTRDTCIAELPYYNDFEEVSKVAGFEYDAHSYNGNSTCGRCGSLHGNITNGKNGNLVVKDGALSFENSDWDGTVCFWYNYYQAEPFHNVELQFKPQKSGTVVFEFDYDCANGGDAVRLGNGFFTVFDSTGNKAAGWYGYNGDGGVYDGGVAGGDKIQIYSWNHAQNDHHFKVEVDLDNKIWTVSGTNVKENLSYSTGDVEDISKISIGLTNSTDKIDNLRIYKKVTAEQADTAFTLNVGETASAKVIYTPATESMFDMTYASSNTAIADVTANGLITARRAGTATITATSAMYGANLSWTVTVPDTTTVTPVAVDYTADFSTDGLEIKDLAGWSILNRQANTVLATTDGKLVAKGVAKYEKTTGAAQAKLAFEAVKSGKLVIEGTYSNNIGEIGNVAASLGLVSVYSENGTKIAGIRADGRGDGRAYSAGVWQNVVLNVSNWKDGGKVKIELNLDEGSYQLYQNNKLLSDSTGDTFWLMDTNAASVEFTFTNEGDFWSDIKVYVPAEASE